jgi:acetamidase/formamidase
VSGHVAPVSSGGLHRTISGVTPCLYRAPACWVVDFLVQQKGFTVPKAFSFASIAVDFHAAEVVDGTQVVTGKIPKRLLEGHGPARR